MKKTFTELPPRIFLRKLIFLRVLIPAAALVAAACTQEPAETMGRGRTLSFDVTRNGGWSTPQVRAENSDEPSLAMQVLKMQGDNPADSMFLHLTVSDWSVDEAAPENAGIKTRAELEETGSFAIDGYSYAPGTWSDNLSPNLMSTLCHDDGNGYWKPDDGDYYWPGKSKKVRFFAFYPESIGLMMANAQSIQFNGTIRFTDYDWLLADTGELAGDLGTPVPLTFRHIFSRIRFAIGDDMMAGKITKITLRNHYRDGVFSFGNASWTSLEQCTAQTIDTYWDTSAAADTGLGSWSIIPQVLPENAQLQVRFTDDLTSTDRTLSVSLAGLELPMGKIVTFRLSTSGISVEPHLQIGWINDFTYEGGSHKYGVASYIEVKGPDGVPQRVGTPWSTEFSTDGGQTWTADRPEWLTDFTSGGEGGYTQAYYYAAVEASQGRVSNPHDSTLQAAPAVNGIYDLSTEGGTAAMNTANCYIINAPGKYSFPLVYGNAIKDGNVNFSAYISSSADLGTLVNHLDAEIRDPYIYNNAGCVPADAVTVWQDEEDLVTDAALSDDGKVITFEVPKQNIRQGNAVIAVRDASGTIMWSWHIWVTDYVPRLSPTVEESYDPAAMQRDKVVTSGEGIRYTFMPLNIGWCYEDITSYRERSVMVRFIQPQTGLSIEKEIIQKSHVKHKGNNTYFEFGRKDPIIGFKYEPYGSSSHTAAYKNCYSSYSFSTAIQTSTIGRSIKYPTSFHTRSNSLRDWERYSRLNRWNTDNAPDRVTKTIYDPSPAGYHVPGKYAFTGIGRGERDSDPYGSTLNSPFVSENDCKDNMGMVFYCNAMKGEGIYDKAGGIIFFPFSGKYEGILGLTPYAAGDSGSYWTEATRVSNDGTPDKPIAISMYTSSIVNSPIYGDSKCTGNSVRPVREP